MVVEQILKERNNLDPSYLYSRSHPPFFELFRTWDKTTQTDIRKKYRDKIIFIESVLNTDYAIGSYYIPLALSPTLVAPRPQSDIVFSAYHRNFFALYASLDLTNRGLFGPARSVLRHVFESLVIAKFCSLSTNNKVYQKWREGQSIPFTNTILNKIIKPSPAVFREYWSVMSEFVHASVYAQQMSFDWEHLHGNVQFNWDLILALLECHYHVLVSHLVTPSIRYYSDYASIQLNRGDKAILSQRKKLIQSLFSKAKKSSIPSFRKLIRDFKSTWDVES